MEGNEDRERAVTAPSSTADTSSPAGIGEGGGGGESGGGPTRGDIGARSDGDKGRGGGESGGGPDREDIGAKRDGDKGRGGGDRGGGEGKGSAGEDRGRGRGGGGGGELRGGRGERGEGGSPSKSAPPAESRSRKRVTFDLDLQVKTIPNRIPIYERRPAGSGGAGTGPGTGSPQARPHHHQPLAFVPRPLDPKGRDRYLLGATTTRKIIDLFGLPNGFPSYPMPPGTKGGSARKGRYPSAGGAGAGQAGHQAASVNGLMANPNYTFANFRAAKMSRAALSLKQITAALGEHFDSSVYKEWEDQRRGAPSPSSSSSSSSTSSPASSRPGIRSASSLVNELGVSHTRRIGSGCGSVNGGGSNAIAAFSPSRLRTQQHHHSNHHQARPNSSAYHPSSHGEASLQTPPDSRDRSQRILPSVSSEQVALNSRSQHQHHPSLHRRRSAGPDSASYHNHARQDIGSPTGGGSSIEGGGGGGGGSGAHEAFYAGRDRPPSRCSTIETYVISDIPGTSRPSPSSAATLGAGARSGSAPSPSPSAAGQRRLLVGPSPRSVAWEAGLAIPINEPVLSVSAIRTSPSRAPSDGGAGGLVQWQVTSRPPNLST